jgi:hypothetical protein
MRKISETILDFGAPLLSMFDEPPTIDTMKHTLLFVLTVWNAHVMATPIWGKPEHLEALRKQFEGASPSHRAIAEILSQRWRDHCADDSRAVAEWDVIPDGKGGHAFQCDARWPGTA